MKKLFAFTLALAMALTLFACSKAPDPVASSSGPGGPKLYILADRGVGKMYYKVLELHPDAEFDGADEPMDEKYIEYLIRCQVYEEQYRDWTNGEAEECLRGKAYRLEREYSAANLAKFNELGLTTDKLHTLLNLSYGVEDIMKMTADQVPGSIEGPAQSDVVIYNKLYAVVPSAKAKMLTADEVTVLGLTAETTQEELVQKLGEPKEIVPYTEEQYEKKAYIYDDMRFTFIETLNGEPFSYPGLYLAEFTNDDLTYMRGIKLGDSLYDVVSNFPQELDYRSGRLYGDKTDKFSAGFAELQTYDVLTLERGNYELFICCGWWPTVCFNFDDNLKTESVYIYYHSNGLSYP